MSWEVLALRYATRPMTRGEAFPDDPDPAAPLEMAYYLWLLRGADRGAGSEAAATVLVDSGYSVAAGRRRGRPEHLVAPLDALARVGVGVEDVDLVVNTHLHFDHTGYLDTFADVPLLVGATELAAAAAGVDTAHVEGEDVARIAARDGVVAMGARHAVAPGIEAIEVGGHSPGQIVLVIEGEQAPVVLASDAVHFYEELEDERPFAVVSDVDAMRRAYGTIRTLVEERDARLVAGHDPLVMERFAPLDDAELGVRVA